MQTAQHIGAPPGARFADSTALWRPPPGAQICRQYSTLAPPRARFADSAAHWRPPLGGPDLQTLQQIGGPPGARFADSAAHWRPQFCSNPYFVFSLPEIPAPPIPPARHPHTRTPALPHTGPGWAPSESRLADNTAHWRPRGPDLQTVHYIDAPGGQICRQYSTLALPRGPDLQTVQRIGAPGARFADTTAHWRPRGPDLQTVQHTGAPQFSLILISCFPCLNSSRSPPARPRRMPEARTPFCDGQHKKLLCARLGHGPLATETLGKRRSFARASDEDGTGGGSCWERPKPPKPPRGPFCVERRARVTYFTFLN